MPGVKELDFFAGRANWSRGFDWYKRQFAPAASDVVAVGEASTLYTKFPQFKDVPKRISDHLPDVRLLYVVRDPVERVRSHYQHRAAVGAERGPVEEVLRNPIYLDCSRYTLQIEQYLRWFSDDQLLVIASEELRQARQETVARVFQFLGVDRNYAPPELDQEFYRSRARVVHSPAAYRVRQVLKERLPATKRAKEWMDSRSHLVRDLWSSEAKRRRELGSCFNPVPLPDRIACQLRDALADDVMRLGEYVDFDPAAWWQPYE